MDTDGEGPSNSSQQKGFTLEELLEHLQVCWGSGCAAENGYLVGGCIDCWGAHCPAGRLMERSVCRALHPPNLLHASTLLLSYELINHARASRASHTWCTQLFACRTAGPSCLQRSAAHMPLLPAVTH